MLRHASDVRSLFIVALYFGLFASLWITDPLRTMPWPVTVLWVGITCWISWCVATITHNSIHAPMFRSRTLNKVWQVVLTLGYGHPVSSYVPGHNMSHHNHTQTAKDVMRTTKARFRWNLLNLFTFMPAVGRDIMANDIAFTKAMRQRRPRWFRQLVIEGVVFFGVSAALLLADVFATGSPRFPWMFVLYWYLPHFAAAWGIITINYFQHDGCDQDHEWNHSRNFVGGFLNWWTCNNGYHTVHHMKPGMHWSELPAFHDRVVKPHIHPALDQQSLLGYAFTAFIWPGRRLRYDGRPVDLPPRVPDESWIPERLPEAVSLGAEA